MLTLILIAMLGAFMGITGWFWAIWWISMIFKVIWFIISLITKSQE